jgi:glycerol uptake facilitator-like aquaporin
LIRTIFYVIAQLVGAIAGTAATLLCYPYEMRMKGGGGVINIVAGTEPWNAMFMEFFLTMGLVFGAFSIAFDPRGWGKLGPIGLATIVGLHFHVGAAVSFGAMNPARVFGPAVIYNSWENHWVYWVGGIVGAAVGGCTYEYLFMKREHARSTVPSTAGETSKKRKFD